MLTGATLLVRSYYLGTSLLAAHVVPKYQVLYARTVIAIAWIGCAALFGQGANLSRLSLSGDEALLAAGLGAAVAYGAAALSRFARPTPLFRSYVMAVIVVSLFCAYQLGDAPPSVRDRVFFDYLLYTAASFIGIRIGSGLFEQPGT
jgi:hypothetical protein